ncbi:MAG TPA: hypothetical protein VE733_26905 [Streptosporangiaceae bacterium]|nr:hypothetical protein [Streptosporangiaceae bacterium]
MDIRPLSELQKPDERTLRFNPYGLGGRMRPEDSAEFQQQVVACHELVPAAADSTRQSFEQLKTIYVYGVLCYDIFTVVHDHALLVFEQALRDRFIDFHHGKVTFVNPQTNEEKEVTADRYEQVYKFVDRHRKWQLRVGQGQETIEFNGMLGGLREWARRAGLLRGQRNRGIERAISSLRDLVAHRTAYHLTTPVDAATTIGDLAEIINHLWGAPTPGGRLYPAPIPRTVIALMWNREGTGVRSAVVADLPDDLSTGEGTAELETAEQDQDDWTYVLVRGVAHDWDLLHWFDARYETATMPSEWLWGPGTAHEALAWLRQTRPEGDEVDILDRLFLIRFHNGLLYLPRNLEIAAGVADDEKPGVWYLIRADSPLPAFNHLRQLLAGGFACNPDGRCKQCPVETIGTGSWQEVMDMLTNSGLKMSKREVPDVRVPSIMGGIRCNRILNGSWDIPDQCR